MVILISLVLILCVIQFGRLYFSFSKNKKALKALNKYQKELEYLCFLTSCAVLENLPIKESFTKFLNTLKETLNWTYHSIFRLDEDKQVLIIRFTGYLPDWFMNELSSKVFIKVGDATIGRVISTKQPVIMNSVQVDPRFKNLRVNPERVGFQSLSCYPMIGRLKTYGGFCTYSEFEDTFTLHSVQFFLTCANLFALILEDKLFDKYLTD